jgi:hypothetical protein
MITGWDSGMGMRFAASSIACGFPANGASQGSVAFRDGPRDTMNRTSRGILGAVMRIVV